MYNIGQQLDQSTIMGYYTFVEEWKKRQVSPPRSCLLKVEISKRRSGAACQHSCQLGYPFRQSAAYLQGSQLSQCPVHFKCPSQKIKMGLRHDIVPFK